MRIYKPGETVRLPDDSLATVVTAVPFGDRMGYEVKLEDGQVVTARDSDVRNPPRAA